MSTIHINDPFESMLSSDEYADSLVIGLTGPKRSGKSLEFAKILYKLMRAGRKVWSNLPVCTPKIFLDKGYPMLKTMDIDWDAFFAMSEEYQDGVMGLDEAGGINSNRGSLSTRNRVSNSFYNQLGHRNLNLIWTAKSQAWLDRQGLGYETDIEIECHDMAKTPWGRLCHIKKGTQIFMKAFDRSGSTTGRVASYRDIHAGYFKKWIDLRADIYWTAYSTRVLQPIDEIFGNVKLDIQKRIITNKTQIAGDMSRVLYTVASQFRKSVDKIDLNTFWRAVNNTGIPGDSRQLGKYLKTMNIIKKHKGNGYYYDLSNMETL